jgi:hypothetical protein
MFARVKRRADRGGISRHDTRMGGVLCERDGTVAWSRGQAQADGLLTLARKRWRQGSGSRTMQEERRLKGEAKAPVREAKLAKKRSGRAKKASQLERLKAVESISKYSALTKMGNDELSDQLKIFKLLEKKTGFCVTGTRIELVMRLQNILFEKFGASSNDLPDGDSGVTGRGVRRRKADGATGKAKGKKRKKSTIVVMGEWEWDSTEEFEIEMLIGKMVVTDGETEVPGRGTDRLFRRAPTNLYTMNSLRHRGRVATVIFKPCNCTWRVPNQRYTCRQPFVPFHPPNTCTRCSERGSLRRLRRGRRRMPSPAASRIS